MVRMLQQRCLLVEGLLVVSDWQIMIVWPRLMLQQRFALQFALVISTALVYQQIQQLELLVVASINQQKQHLVTAPNHLAAFITYS